MVLYWLRAARRDNNENIWLLNNKIDGYYDCTSCCSVQSESEMAGRIRPSASGSGDRGKQYPVFLAMGQRILRGHRGIQRRDLGRKEIESYLSQIAKEPGMSSWRVEQARQALEWYYKQFRDILFKPRQAAAVTVREET